MLDSLAQFLGADRAAALNLTVSAFLAITGVVAAIAAWRAATATKRTVEEMREARLQSVRPVLLPQLPSALTLAWDHSEGFMVLGADRAVIPFGGIRLEIGNRGNGPALGAIATFGSADDALTMEELIAVGNLFASVDYLPRRDTTMTHLELVRDGVKRSLMIGDLVNMRKTVGDISPTGQAVLEVTALFLLYAASRALAWKLTAEDELRSYSKAIQLEWSSVAGEHSAEWFELEISFSRVQFWDGDGQILETLPSGKWERFEVDVYLHVQAADRIKYIPRPDWVPAVAVHAGDRRKRRERALRYGLALERWKNFWARKRTRKRKVVTEDRHNLS
jgi:hypothetical protein